MSHLLIDYNNYASLEDYQEYSQRLSQVSSQYGEGGIEGEGSQSSTHGRVQKE